MAGQEVSQITPPVDPVASEKFFVRLSQLHKQKGPSIRRFPVIGHKELDMYQLFLAVEARGGLNEVVKNKKFKEIALELDLPRTVTNAGYVLRTKYESLIQPFENILRDEFYPNSPSYEVEQSNPHIPLSESLSLPMLPTLGIPPMPEPFALTRYEDTYKQPDVSSTESQSIKQLLSLIYKYTANEMSGTNSTSSEASDRMSTQFLRTLPPSSLQSIIALWPAPVLSLTGVGVLSDTLFVATKLSEDIKTLIIRRPSKSFTGKFWPPSHNITTVDLSEWSSPHIFGFDQLRALIEAYPNVEDITVSSVDPELSTRMQDVACPTRVRKLTIENAPVSNWAPLILSHFSSLKELTIKMAAYKGPVGHHPLFYAYQNSVGISADIQTLVVDASEAGFQPEIALATLGFICPRLTNLTLINCLLRPLPCEIASAGNTTNTLHHFFPRLSKLVAQKCSGRVSCALPDAVELDISMTLRPPADHKFTPREELASEINMMGGLAGVANLPVFTSNNSSGGSALTQYRQNPYLDYNMAPNPENYGNNNLSWDHNSLDNHLD